MRFNEGDRVCVIPFDEIDREAADGHWTSTSCYGIGKSAINKSSEKEFWVVESGGVFTAALEGSPYSWLNCMLRPYEEEELDAPESDAIFTSLFGAEVEVVR